MNRKNDDRRKRAIIRIGQNLVSLEKDLADLRRRQGSKELSSSDAKNIAVRVDHLVKKVEETKMCLKNTERNLRS